MYSFRRKIYNSLLEWKNSSNGRTALLIEGARRIGKTTVVLEFGKKEYKSVVYIDFSLENKKFISSLFDNISNLDYFFLQLKLHYGVELFTRNSLIIFDEVQFFPPARQAIKHLVKDGRYDYIETGSLISIKKNVANILIPSEERKIKMYPMDWEEFNWALGDNKRCELVKEIYENRLPLSNQLHNYILKNYRLYMAIGGMPQAVSEYIDRQNFKYVDEVKRDILHLYKEDLFKLDRSEKALFVYNSFTSDFAKRIDRFTITSLSKNTRIADIMETLTLLEESSLVMIANNIFDPSRDFYSTIDRTKFKLFLSDVGLLVTKMFDSKSFTENIIYEKLLLDKLDTNLGYLMENVAAQTLQTLGHNLYYHTFLDKISHHSYEIDFLISSYNKITPIEVKSSSYKRHRSLDMFCEKYNSRLAEKKYIIYTKPPVYTKYIDYLPIYMLGFVK